MSINLDDKVQDEKDNVLFKKLEQQERNKCSIGIIKNIIIFELLLL